MSAGVDVSVYAVEVVIDQVFSMAGGKPRLADLYLPLHVSGKLPVILWVHGGGWSSATANSRRTSPDSSRNAGLRW
jgi:acetyl esterase/lipase